MQIYNHTFVIETSGPGFYDISRSVRDWLAKKGCREGQVTLLCQHTSASLTINENADPDVRLDLMDHLDELAPRNKSYRHHMEGLDDMPGHIKTMLTGPSLTIPVMNGAMALGTWQGIFLIEHRDAPHNRKIALSFVGASSPA